MGYYGGQLKNHGHTSNPGDGGLLSNLTLGGLTTIGDVEFTSATTAFDQGFFTSAGVTIGGSITANGFSSANGDLTLTNGGISIGNNIALLAGKTLTVGGVNYLAPPMGIREKVTGTTSGTTPLTLLNYTGTGRLLGINMQYTVPTDTFLWSVTIDGVDYCYGSVLSTGGAQSHLAPSVLTTSILGLNSIAGTGTMNNIQWFFKTSIVVTVTRNSGTGTLTGFVLYERP